MAKLITDHDPFHIHKILGVLVLIHALYRLYLWPTRGFIFCQAGNESCTEKDLHFDVACNLLHAALSWSSLLLPLPAKRNFNSPMIWKEFRWHSIIFATRSVTTTIISILGLWPKSHWALNAAAKLGVIMATCYAADFATAKFGCSERRTTNAMPYPDCCTPTIQRGIKLNYALSQFNATIACVTESADFPWSALIAIQGAPLLMTLVRKGKVSALFYHRMYTAQLFCPVGWLMLITPIYAKTNPWAFWNFQIATVFLVGGHATFYIRTQLRCSKWTTWMAGVAITNFALHSELGQKIWLWLHTTPLGVAIVVACYTDVFLRKIVNNFLPIYTLKAVDMKMPEEYLMNAVRFVTKGDWNVRMEVSGAKKVE